MFSVDDRSLGLFRIAISVLLCLDLVFRMPHIKMFYSDAGVLPRALLVQLINPFHISFHLVSGASSVMAVIFIIQFLLAIALLIGLKSRIVSILSWMLLTSLHTRNPYINEGGDLLLRMLLFWGMFLPLGKAYSLDAMLGSKRKSSESATLSLATAAVMLQVGMVYLFTALEKGGQAWADGTAVFFALNNDRFATAFGTYLLNYPEFLSFLTYAVKYFEFYGALLLFFPYKNAQLRSVLIIGFFVLQIGFAACLNLGNFPWVSCAAMIPFIPASFWRTKTGSFVSHALENLQRTFHSLKTRAKDVQRNSEREENKSRLHRTALFQCAADGAIIILLIYITAWNLSSPRFTDMPLIHPKSGVSIPGRLLHIEQRWKMFAPEPAKKSGWHVVVGKLANGKKANLLNPDAELTWRKPERGHAVYSGQRENKFMTALLQKKNKNILYNYALYMCREWNQPKSKQPKLTEVSVYFMQETAYPDRKPSSPKRVLLTKRSCPRSWEL